MSGLGQRCMYCSGSESAQVEHHRPKGPYPDLALVWENFLWICGICNQAKSQTFDPLNPPIDPATENVWDFFFIDRYGNLTPRWNAVLDELEPRAVETIRLMDLDRQALQECRQERLIDLRSKAIDSLALLRAGELTQDELEFRALAWLDQPFQPDIADYFLAGPGASDNSEPFAALVAVLDGGAP
jgi:uncharacterized protein (TIGR02646 family)